MFGIGGQEMLIILVLVVLLFGAKKLPEVMRGMGQGIREFRKASREILDSDTKSSVNVLSDETGNESEPLQPT